MENSHTSRAQINNELAARGTNKRVKKVIEDHMPDNEKPDLQIDFYCECSDPDCGERVSLTLEQFETLHNEQSRFVITKGHSSPSVEKVLKTKGSIQIVEKYAL